MNTHELAGHLQLHPRAVLMHGTIELRMKNSGSLPGLTPHYAMPGCPIVQYDGANAVEEPNAAEIEFNVMETGFPLPAVLLGYSPKQGNMVQVMFGRNGMAPSQASYRVLREVAGKLAALAATKRPLFFATLPVLTPGQYGIATGRHYLVGLFDEAGTPLWIHPEANPTVLKAEFPADQRERSTASAPAQQAPAPAAWYEPMRVALASTGMKGKALHDNILKARAHQLVEQGAAPNQKAALALAMADLALANPQGPQDAPQAPQNAPKAPQAPSSRSQAGKALLGKKG